MRNECPFCGDLAHSPAEERMHMESKHPAVIDKRLSDAGLRRLDDSIHDKWPPDDLETEISFTHGQISVHVGNFGIFECSPKEFEKACYDLVRALHKPSPDPEKVAEVRTELLDMSQKLKRPEV